MKSSVNTTTSSKTPLQLKNVSETSWILEHSWNNVYLHTSAFCPFVAVTKTLLLSAYSSSFIFQINDKYTGRHVEVVNWLNKAKRILYGAKYLLSMKDVKKRRVRFHNCYVSKKMRLKHGPALWKQRNAIPLVENFSFIKLFLSSLTLFFILIARKFIVDHFYHVHAHHATFWMWHLLRSEGKPNFRWDQSGLKEFDEIHSILKGSTIIATCLFLGEFFSLVREVLKLDGRRWAYLYGYH